MMKHGFLGVSLCALLLFVGAAPLGASFQFYPISTGLREASACRVAAAPWGTTVVAWVEADSVWTRRWTYGGLDPAVNHGPGVTPDVAYGEGDFVLAFEQTGNIVVREGNGTVWADAANYGFALEVRLPRLTGWLKEQWWEYGLYLCFQTDYGTVRFAERAQGVWQQAENVLESGTIGMPSFAQALPVPNGEGLWRPRVYMMQEADLVYSERVGGVWQEPVGLQPEGFVYGGEFAVAAGYDDEQHVLSNGPQPTCPCNVIHYSHGSLAGPWSDPEDLTSEFDEYTWPQDPAIAVDAGGAVHAVWFQQHYDSMMMPSWRGLFYRVLDDGIWADYSEQLCCMRGESADMDLRFNYTPAIVWTQSDDAPSQVVLALDPGATATESAPAAAFALSAQPNPFNPKTTLRFALSAPGAAELAICDVSGRRLRTLFKGALPAGEQRLDWDGLDAAGRELPSGIYFARLANEGASATIKLVLLR
jgi:hypothetical protein